MTCHLGPWNSRELAYLRSARAAGSSYREIAVALGRPEHRCRMQAHRQGMTRGERERRSAQLARIRRLHHAGNSAPDIAEKVGLHPTTVRSHLKRSGLVAHPATGRGKTNREKSLSSAAGWPPVGPRARAVLVALAERGRLGLREVGAVLGVPTRSLAPTLSRLRRCGHIVGVGYPAVYSLTPEVLARHQVAVIRRREGWA